MRQAKVQVVEEVTVRFAGDSGDGMQLTGSQFTNTTALLGNDLSTLPDYPAEIRAPAGTVYGVSGFQLHFSSSDIATPGDKTDVLVAMNPAALKVNLRDLKPNAIILANSNSFDAKNLKLADYQTNPLEDDTLAGYTVFAVPMTQLTIDALADVKLGLKEKDRCKNFFALGLMYWLYSRPINTSNEWIEEKFASKGDVLLANKLALEAGYHYGEMNELFTTRYHVESAKLPPGTYKNVSGNEATALGFVAAAYKSGLQLFLGSYPITPASEILHELSKFKKFGVKTFQAEDEIAGICSAIGASFAGSLGVTTTSGPGLALKTEAMGLAVITELPLVIVNVQRGGPSTGLPTKTEQADLLQSIYGRNGEAPICVLAAATPADCFNMTFEACRIALKYMTPVILLTDGYLGNGSEPFRVPDEKELPEIPVKFVTEKEGFFPYSRDLNLVRPWAIPGTPGLEHRIGGLEKTHIYGNVSYVPENHDYMVRIREEKVKNIVQEVPDLEVRFEQEGELLIIGWGSTYGAIFEAVNRVRRKGHKVSQAHFKYMNPMPKNTREVLGKFKKVLLPEINLGQFARVLRSELMIDVTQHNVVQGLPFKASDIEQVIYKMLGVEDAE